MPQVDNYRENWLNTILEATPQLAATPFEDILKKELEDETIINELDVINKEQRLSHSHIY